ncbi:hypothetical protein TNIN_212711 [Trichonephila inaurata madagascariensis]|uniref:Uncharacterized protein n=1 Tax=Trichonephila inaurata madagascariensis TaxID=2747483 RepID=A0A8X6WVS9_9ARAC|nr:hypothetical protein TNIN_212711 [Trichonephila inaurata madagascariensis]
MAEFPPRPGAEALIVREQRMNRGKKILSFSDTQQTAAGSHLEKFSGVVYLIITQVTDYDSLRDRARFYGSKIILSLFKSPYCSTRWDNLR